MAAGAEDSCVSDRQSAPLSDQSSWRHFELDLIVTLVIFGQCHGTFSTSSNLIYHMIRRCVWCDFTLSKSEHPQRYIDRLYMFFYRFAATSIELL